MIENIQIFRVNGKGPAELSLYRDGRGLAVNLRLVFNSEDEAKQMWHKWQNPNDQILTILQDINQLIDIKSIEDILTSRQMNNQWFEQESNNEIEKYIEAHKKE